MNKPVARAALFLSFLTFFCTARNSAQGLTSNDIRSQMVQDWERAKAYTLEYLNTMPADKYTFKPVDSVRTFAQHMLHLAQFNCRIMSMATDIQPPAWVMSDPQHRLAPQVRDSVVHYVTESYDFCINAVKSFDPNNWGEKKNAFHGIVETRFALMNKAFEHQTHHRAQTTVYIRLLGIKPPDEKLF